MNKYLDFESDIEILDSKINKLQINDSNFLVEKNKLIEKKNILLKKNIQIYQHGKKYKSRGTQIDLIQLII